MLLSRLAEMGNTKPMVLAFEDLGAYVADALKAMACDGELLSRHSAC